MYQSEARIHLHDGAQNEVAGNGSGIWDLLSRWIVDGDRDGDGDGDALTQRRVLCDHGKDEISATNYEIEITPKSVWRSIRFEPEDQESAFFRNTTESSWIKCPVPTPDICVYMYTYICISWDPILSRCANLRGEEAPAILANPT